ncbi:UDP-glycosyltransferase 88B1-like isoform X1 [Sesamum indicum]|uniref:Glycosyltransferase n=1 Tax=Sesamum indicum TaxID=4182 RepID=A0A8M8UYJ0_SESIN|nr:UDP-glycosyltransferase 88B1-like isoform X1 [Sesamum indicum]
METVVLYPSPGMGHLIALVELGKLILHHHPSFSLHILIVLPSYYTGSTAAYIRHISATVPSITFHYLPPISLELDSFPSTASVTFEVLHRSNPHVRRILESISLSATISAIVIDMFCTCALPIAAELNIPTYYFMPSGACDLALLLHFPTLHNATTKSFRDMNTILHVPGIPPLPSSDLSDPMLYRNSMDYESLLNFAQNIPNSAGIIVNTFESLETKPLNAIREGKCNPGGHTPPVFPVGPLFASEDRHDCLNWLDKQPSKSVVFLCFGSLGLFSAAQLKEIAVGLERSGQRFLWVVRSPPSDDKSKRYLPPPEPDLDTLLPAGFLDRTKDRGLVLKSWAPQVAVLNHESVGGFVTHCGWNSVMEAVWAAVPMVTWPLYAEQKMNRVVLVKELKVALRMEVADDDFVAAEEVERRLRELMESEKGREIRKVVEEKSVEARAAMREGGSSIAAIGKLVELWKRA